MFSSSVHHPFTAPSVSLYAYRLLPFLSLFNYPPCFSPLPLRALVVWHSIHTPFLCSCHCWSSEPMFQNQMTCNGVPSSFFPASFMWPMQPHEENHQMPITSLNPQDFRGVSAVLGKRSVSFSGIETCDEINGEDYLSDDGSQAGEKKRRLNLEQVRTLEKNFEIGNRLEPERKIQLARALGLQPRQIAIWFQNRRARWKTKQLEKDYDALKMQFEIIKSENDALQSQNKKLHDEILALKGRETSEPINLNKDTEVSCSNRSDNSSDINFDMPNAAITATDSSISPNQSRSFSTYRPATAQLLQNSSRTEIQCLKTENVIQEEGFCHVFSNMEDQSAFWSWSDQQNFQ